MMERSSMIWMVDYLLNSAWQAPLVLLVALLAARLVARLFRCSAPSDLGGRAGARYSAAGVPH